MTTFPYNSKLLGKRQRNYDADLLAGKHSFWSTLLEWKYMEWALLL
jgi:hypothetical protein